MENNKRFMTRRAFSMWIKTVACVLSILMMLYAVPTNVFAELIDAIDGALENQADEVTVEDTLKKEVFEVIDRREETVKHFRTEDGSFTAVQYNVPIHEKDENGEWQDIDNTLSESGSEYATSNARVKFAKKTTGNETLFTLHDGNRKITMSLSGANKKVAGQVSNTQTEFPEDATPLQKMMTLDKLSSKILYPEILDGVDLEYVVESCNIKENIIVKVRADSYSYTFEIKLNNLEAVLCEDGSVAISDPDTDEVVYTIPKGYMFDADGEYSDAVTYTLTNGGNGKYTLTVTADAAWINDEGRIFPVTVDPPINSTAYASGIVDTYIDSSNPSAYYTNYSYLASGTGGGGQEFISYWRINSLPTIPANAYLVSAEFSLYCQDYRNYSDDDFSEDSSMKIGAYHVTTNWDTSNTWSKHTSYNAGAFSAADLIDYAKVNKASENHYVSWNITRLFKMWNQGTANYGITLGRLQQGESDVLFASSETANDPRLIIHYRDMKGVESYWSGSSHSAGLAGNGYVNHATGNLVFVVNLIGTGDALFGYTPSLVYNSAIANQFNTNGNVPYKRPSSGYGWKLSTDDSLVMKTYYDETGMLKTSYVWVDGDGTEHYFIWDEEISSWKDEDGLGLTLTYDSITQKLLIKDLNHTEYQYAFSSATNELNVGGILECVRDPYGNELIFDNNTQGHPTSIKVLPSGHLAENAIQYLTLSYSSLGALCRIQNNVTGQVMTFEYGMSFTDSSFLSPTVSGPLYKVIYGHMFGSSLITDAVITYSYTNVAGDSTDTIYRLSSAKDDNSGTELRYTYNITGQVETITEYGKAEDGEAVQGQSIRYTYGTGYTEVRSSGNDDILQNGTNSDDIITHYSFDNQGRAISAYSTNADRTAMYGATNQIYLNQNADGEDSGNTVNSLKSAAVIDSVSVNNVYNGGFDLVNASTIPGWGKSSSNVTVIFDMDRYSYALQMQTSANDSEDVYQNVTLPAGTYTLSAECKASITGMNLTMSILDGSNQIASKSYSIANVSGVSHTMNPSLTFTLEEAKPVRVQLTSEGSATESGSMTVDNISLVNTVGAASYNMVQFGGFEDTYADTNGSAAPADFWQTTGALGATIGTTGGLFDQCLRITGNVNRDQRVTQRITVLPTRMIETPDTGGLPTVNLVHFKNRTFTVSGFAKANAPIANADALFSLSVSIYYYGESEPEIIDYHFNKELSDWQFVSGTFTTPPDKIVQHIDVSCVYANQPNTAYFDQISLVEGKGTNAAVYEYNNTGLVELISTPLSTTYTQYNDHNKPVYTFDSQGNGCYYAYNGNVLLSQTTFKHYITIQDSEQQKTKPWDLYGWYYLESRQEQNPFDAAEPPEYTVISKTEYNINAYGLNTSTVSYAAEGDIETANRNGRSPRLITRKTYNLTAGSYLFGRTTSVTDADGKTTNFVYDSRGLLLYEYDGMNHGLYHTYDALGRQTGILPLMYSPSVNSYYSQYGAESVAYTYDPQSNRPTQITTATTTYTFTYDSFGNQKSILVGSNILVEYTYNQNNGKLLRIKYGTGETVDYSYDVLDRVIEKCYNKDTEAEYRDLYTYTANGAINSVESTKSGRCYDYLYDSKGNLLEVTECAKDDEGNYIPLIGHSYVYDGLDRLEQKLNIFDYMVGSSSTGETAVAYYYYYEDYGKADENGVPNVGELQALEISGAGFDTESTISYGYDALYRLTTKNLILDGVFSIQSNYEYTNTTQIKQHTSSIVIGNDISAETIYKYTYDVSGNIVRIVENDDKSIVYKYDDLGQLIQENNKVLGKAYVYTYDNGGNRTSKTTYDYSDGVIGEELSQEEYTYGTGAWKDQLTQIKTNGVVSATFSYDAIGNPQSYNGYTLTWDGRKLTEMNMGAGQFRYSFEYNEDGIRTAKYSNGTWHYYTLEDSRVVTERFGNKLLVYLYDESGSPIGLQYRTDSYAANKFDTFFFEKNIFGDIVAIYNADGDKIGSYVYDAWGNCTVSTESGITVTERSIVRTYNPFRYRGYYYDADTGLYYLQSRYYNPQWGRFLNADGYASTGQGLLGYNMYAYCGNNPVNRKDPAGQFWITALVVAVVVTVCTFTLSGCSSNNKTKPAPKPYSNQANCYAYAMKLENDPRTDQPFTRKPQPGEFSGSKLTARDLKGTSETVKQAINEKVLADAKVLNLNYTEVYSADHVPKEGNWVVALAYATDGSDYHWWRKNDDGTWSHKPGSTPIIHWDASGNVITDPGNCDRGSYDGFLGYYEVGPN